MADQPKLTERHYLRMLVQFAEDAPGLDFNEDRVLQWIAVVTAGAKAAMEQGE